MFTFSKMSSPLLENRFTFFLPDIVQDHFAMLKSFTNKRLSEYLEQILPDEKINLVWFVF
jgi:hypothetical protein